MRIERRADPGDVHPDRGLLKIDDETFQFDTYRADGPGLNRLLLDESVGGCRTSDFPCRRLGEGHHALIESDRSDSLRASGATPRPGWP